ncbi:glutamate-5-semialdehyde dehydrogenase [Fructobacillus sp. M158]|uniref:glutamate-5-semialdehyde dehydrogenase n=1 Tax=Fructobacillus parabroussonetiae TaxID=2713174 RepID=UPI00200B3628|nr:glutamate-5-semialdehyde dehydrogenase [Fructobacillus parabroussonetiae]MCK8617036.1 glutamate-5-semialdehyde dehydrogenase [Fructobacillus parabroussonetiae]
MTTITQMGAFAKEASREIAQQPVVKRNAILKQMAASLMANTQMILSANQADLEAASALSGPMLNRLTIDQEALKGIADGILFLVDLKDPLAGPNPSWQHRSGFEIVKKTVPLGVVAMVYEARPNVTADAAALAIKSGNAVILRGGKEAIRTNQALATVLREALSKEGMNPNALQLIEDTTHESVNELLRLREYVDVLIPRGSKAFIDFVVEDARVPVIETGAGNTHLFVDDSADQEKAIRVIVNAKTSKPAVCNAAEKVLVHEAIASDFLPKLMTALIKAGVEVRGDTTAQAIDQRVQPAVAADWAEEYNDLILAVKVVGDVQEAINWINRYSTHHSETILSENPEHVAAFMQDVDAAVVYQNVSTRFTDGFEFGFGAEIGISTQKLHARGPMSLSALTTIKYEVFGDGQIRE